MSKTNGYVVKNELSQPQRAADFLAWHAAHHPGKFVAYNELLKAIMGYARQPLLKSVEVEQLRKKGSRIRELLTQKHSRELISLPGVGIRATTSDDDVLKNVVPKKAIRLQSARASFVNTVTNIDQRKISNSAEMAPLKAWLNHEIKDVLKQISSPEFERKLLPPTTTVPAEGKKGG